MQCDDAHCTTSTSLQLQFPVDSCSCQHETHPLDSPSRRYSRLPLFFYCLPTPPPFLFLVTGAASFAGHAQDSSSFSRRLSKLNLCTPSTTLWHHRRHVFAAVAHSAVSTLNIDGEPSVGPLVAGKSWRSSARLYKQFLIGLPGPAPPLPPDMSPNITQVASRSPYRLLTSPHDNHSFSRVVVSMVSHRFPWAPWHTAIGGRGFGVLLAECPHHQSVNQSLHQFSL